MIVINSNIIPLLLSINIYENLKTIANQKYGEIETTQNWPSKVHFSNYGKVASY